MHWDALQEQRRLQGAKTCVFNMKTGRKCGLITVRRGPGLHILLDFRSKTKSIFRAKRKKKKNPNKARNAITCLIACWIAILQSPSPSTAAAFTIFIMTFSVSLFEMQGWRLRCSTIVAPRGYIPPRRCRSATVAFLIRLHQFQK